MKTTKGFFLWRSRWYSICSKHQIAQDDCPLCNHGGWHNVYWGEIGRFIYNKFPRVWRWLVNQTSYKLTKFK